jgi:hypothetical protein
VIHPLAIAEDRIDFDWAVTVGRGFMDGSIVALL